MTHHVGILAYGSLIDNPGSELTPRIRLRTPTRTPFKVEFARSSGKRDGGPTLIPVELGGSPVNGQILILDDQSTPREAANMLWRRETGKTGTYEESKNPTVDTVIIEHLPDFEGIETVLYTRIGSNISELTPRKLAELAIDSAREDAGERREDGISYLLNARNEGIKTPLSDGYEREILDLVGVQSLHQAVDAIRNR